MSGSWATFCYSKKKMVDQNPYLHYGFDCPLLLQATSRDGNDNGEQAKAALDIHARTDDDARSYHLAV